MDAGYLDRRRGNIVTGFKLAMRCRCAAAAFEKYFMSKNAKAKILDVGACDGKMLSYIKGKYPGADCFGIDAEKKFMSSSMDSHIRLSVGNGENMEFADDTFDAVIISSALEHMMRPELCLKETFRVLKAGGALFLITVVGECERFARMLGLKKDDHYNNFAPQVLERMLKGCGFALLEMRKDFPFYRLTVAEKI